MDGFQLMGIKNQFEEAVYFLPLSSGQKLLLLIYYQPLWETVQILIQRTEERSIGRSWNIISPQVDEGFWL